MQEKGYKKFLFWQEADELAFQIYQITKIFPKDELYGMTSQLRRAAVSIPTNIAEGCGRQNRNELKQFINIALGSTAEVEYLLSLSKRLELIAQEDLKRLEELRAHVARLLFGFYRSLC
jgi:four helix bundle protein